MDSEIFRKGNCNVRACTHKSKFVRAASACAWHHGGCEAPLCPTGSSRIRVMRKLPVVPLCRRRALLLETPNQNDHLRVPPPQEGRVAVVTHVGSGMRWTRRRRKTGGAEAVGEIVWSWRPDAGAKFSRKRFRESDGGKRARSPGRSRISRKTIAQGRPDDSPVPVVLPRAFLLHADHGCGGHPAFPAPSVFRGWLAQQLGRSPRRGNAASYSQLVMPRFRRGIQ
jgi:hypothetical protein